MAHQLKRALHKVKFLMQWPIFNSSLRLHVILFHAFSVISQSYLIKHEQMPENVSKLKKNRPLSYAGSVFSYFIVRFIL